MEALLTDNTHSGDRPSAPAAEHSGGADAAGSAGRETAAIPLTPDQRRHIQALAESMSPDQALWASGYLAGLAGSRLLPEETAAPAAIAGQAAAAVTVLYGSETGNARETAERAGRMMTENGLEARVIDMESYKPNRLKQEQCLIVVTATHGEGDPPEPARPFYEFLMGRKAPKLKGTRFAVLGLGDSSYEHFCQTAKDIDARLAELGGERIHDRVDCDVDYEAPAAAWIEQTATALEAFVDRAPAGNAAVFAQATDPEASAQTPVYHAGNPFPAQVLDRVVLNGRGSDKTTYHVELALGDAGPDYAPGDSLGVIVENDPALVEETVTALGLESDAELVADLRRGYELTVLTPRFVNAYARATGTRPLLDLAGDRQALRRYLDGRQIVDVLREYPPAGGLGADDIRAMLRKLEPRLYSLASSQSACPDEAHLTVAQVRFQSPFAVRHGAASGHLGRRLAMDDGIPVYIEHNERFRLPADPAIPIVMIGAGTGVAPYRAFLQERAEQGAGGRSWLFFGERRFRTDFLYQTEWQQFMKEGVLTRMDVAFSRDQAEKVYVQDRIRQRGSELFAWLEEGAHVYVCGDAKRMAPDVHAALIDVVAAHGGVDGDGAREYVNTLTAERRYKRDVY